MTKTKALNPEQKKTRIVKCFGILPETQKALLTYLGTRPLQEVEGLVVALRQATPLDVTVDEPKQS